MDNPWIVVLFLIVLLTAIFLIKAYARRLAYGPRRRRQKGKRR